jgi:hypothetical protein
MKYCKNNVNWYYESLWWTQLENGPTSIKQVSCSWYNQLTVLIKVSGSG